MNQANVSQPLAPVAILGWGCAGVNAAIALRNAGYTGPIQAFSNTSTPPYSPILTSYYAGGRKSYEECFPWTGDDLADLGVEVVSPDPVESLDPDAHVVETAGGSYPYSKCVIATGATPVPYGFPKVEGYEPMALRTMDDAERLRDALTRPDCRRLLVSGASMVALKALEAALDRGVQVDLVGMNPHVLDFNALPEAAGRFEAGLRALGATLHLGTTVAAVELSDEDPGRGRLRVTLANGETDFFDDIVVAHGMKCNLDFLPAGALETDRALVVDEFMRTSDSDVYAAGDVAQGLELISGQKRIVGIWKNAATQGQVAGTAIAAELAGRAPSPDAAFKGAIATNTIAVKNMLFISAGTMEVSQGRRKEVRDGEDMTVVYIYEQAESGDRLVGFNVVCDADEPGGLAYDTGAMLTLRIEAAAKR